MNKYKITNPKHIAFDYEGVIIKGPSKLQICVVRLLKVFNGHKNALVFVHINNLQLIEESHCITESKITVINSIEELL
jgi:hypothetical protein